MKNVNEMSKITASNLIGLNNYRRCYELCTAYNRFDTIDYNGVTYNGVMFGNDECFDGNDFYQYFHTANGQLLKMFFDICDADGNDIDLDCVDYSKPKAVKLLIPSDNLDPDQPLDLMFDIDAEEWI